MFATYKWRCSHSSATSKARSCGCLQQFNFQPAKTLVLGSIEREKEAHKDGRAFARETPATPFQNRGQMVHKFGCKGRLQKNGILANICAQVSMLRSPSIGRCKSMPFTGEPVSSRHFFTAASSSFSTPIVGVWSTVRGGREGGRESGFFK